MIVLDLTERDDGAGRETRIPPCPKRTWCILAIGHAGACLEKPRAPHEPPDTRIGPERKPYQPLRKGE